jgi:hypothetical protein
MIDSNLISNELTLSIQTVAQGPLEGHREQKGTREQRAQFEPGTAASKLIGRNGVADPVLTRPRPPEPGIARKKSEHGSTIHNRIFLNSQMTGGAFSVSNLQQIFILGTKCNPFTFFSPSSLAVDRFSLQRNKTSKSFCTT